MIDLKRSQVIVYSPNHLLDYLTSTWFIRYGLSHHSFATVSPNATEIESRNQAIQDLVLPALESVDWFIFINQRIIVDDNTLPFLDDVGADVVGCSYETGGNSWMVPDEFHMGLVRIRSEVFKKLKPPWFMFTYNKQGTKIETCECNFLRNSLIEMGCTITRRGWSKNEGVKSSRH